MVARELAADPPDAAGLLRRQARPGGPRRAPGDQPGGSRRHGRDGLRRDPGRTPILATAHDRRGPVGRGRPAGGRDADGIRLERAGCRLSEVMPVRPRGRRQHAAAHLADRRPARVGGRLGQPRDRASMTQAAAAPAIELIDVTKRYGDAVALDGISLQIEAGEFFCLLGPSGCGKTTTLNLIGGFIPLTSGELRIEGQRVNDLPPHRRNVNTVFQNYALFPHMSVADNVAFGLRMERPGRRGGRSARRRVPRPGRPGRLSGPVPGPALRRTGPARRTGPCARQAAGRAAARRAARGARPQAPQADAGRALAHPPPGRHDLRVRDARPGGGAVDGDADRGHGRAGASARSVRRARSTRDRSIGSSPTSSANRTSSTVAITEDGGGGRVPAAQRDDRPDTGERRSVAQRPRRADGPARIRRRRTPRPGRCDRPRS